MKEHTEDIRTIYSRPVSPWRGKSWRATSAGPTRILGQPVPTEVRWMRVFGSGHWPDLHIEAGWDEEPDRRVRWVITDGVYCLLMEGELTPMSNTDVWTQRVLDDRWEQFASITEYERIDLIEDPGFTNAGIVDSDYRLQAIVGVNPHPIRP